MQITKNLPSPSPTTWLVTVTFNSMVVWDDFYRSLTALTGSWKIVVVDNASTDGTREMLERIVDDRILIVRNSTNVGAATGNNQGITFAIQHGAERLLLLNNDVIFASDLVELLNQSMDDSHADAVSPLILFAENTNRIWFGGGGFHSWRGKITSNAFYKRDVMSGPKALAVSPYAPTTCLLLRASVFKDVGLLDDKYFIYWEDADLLYRMTLSGKRVVIDPKISFIHKESVLTGGRMSPVTERYSHRNQIYFCRKFFGLGWVAYTVLWSVIIGFLKLLKGQYTIALFRVRMSAIFEGLTMDLSLERRT